MKRALLFLSWTALSALSAGCNTEIISVDETRFTCVDDAPLLHEVLPCPASHYCTPEGLCRERLDCNEGLGDQKGCTPDSTQCEPLIGPYTAATTCVLGVQTVTSTRPTPGGYVCPEAPTVARACPCGLFEVGFAKGPVAKSYPLFLLLESGNLPIGKLAIAGEEVDWRQCVQVCSSEANCPAEHTCRAAAVVTPRLLEDDVTGRFTIGVCYPNKLTTTSSTVDIAQPDPDACRDKAECARRGMSACHYAVEAVPDHPTTPAGSAWDARFALVARCVGDQGNNLKNDGLGGCESGRECKSGACVNRRCASPCNPRFPASACGGGRDCLTYTTSERVPSGQVVEDVVQVCEP